MAEEILSDCQTLLPPLHSAHIPRVPSELIIMYLTTPSDRASTMFCDPFRLRLRIRLTARTRLHNYIVVSFTSHDLFLLATGLFKTTAYRSTSASPSGEHSPATKDAP